MERALCVTQLPAAPSQRAPCRRLQGDYVMPSGVMGFEHLDVAPHKVGGCCKLFCGAPGSHAPPYTPNLPATVVACACRSPRGCPLSTCASTDQVATTLARWLMKRLWAGEDLGTLAALAVPATEAASPAHCRHCPVHTALLLPLLRRAARWFVAAFVNTNLPWETVRRRHSTGPMMSWQTFPFTRFELCSSSAPSIVFVRQHRTCLVQTHSKDAASHASSKPVRFVPG